MVFDHENRVHRANDIATLRFSISVEPKCSYALSQKRSIRQSVSDFHKPFFAYLARKHINKCIHVSNADE